MGLVGFGAGVVVVVVEVVAFSLALFSLERSVAGLEGFSHVFLSCTMGDVWGKNAWRNHFTVLLHTMHFVRNYNALS